MHTEHTGFFIPPLGIYLLVKAQNAKEPKYWPRGRWVNMIWHIRAGTPQPLGRTSTTESEGRSKLQNNICNISHFCWTLEMYVIIHRHLYLHLYLQGPRTYKLREGPESSIKNMSMFLLAPFLWNEFLKISPQHICLKNLEEWPRWSGVGIVEHGSLANHSHAQLLASLTFKKQEPKGKKSSQSPVYNIQKRWSIPRNLTEVGWEPFYIIMKPKAPNVGPN